MAKAVLGRLRVSLKDFFFDVAVFSVMVQSPFNHGSVGMDRCGLGDKKTSPADRQGFEDLEVDRRPYRGCGRVLIMIISAICICSGFI